MKLLMINIDKSVDFINVTHKLNLLEMLVYIFHSEIKTNTVKVHDFINSGDIVDIVINKQYEFMQVIQYNEVMNKARHCKNYKDFSNNIDFSDGKDFIIFSPFYINGYSWEYRENACSDAMQAYFKYLELLKKFD